MAVVHRLEFESNLSQSSANSRSTTYSIEAPRTELGHDFPLVALERSFLFSSILFLFSLSFDTLLFVWLDPR